MKIVLKNRTAGGLITVIDRRTRKTIDLFPGKTCELFVGSEEEIKEYKQSYEAFGIDVTVKQPEEKFENECIEAPAEAAPVGVKTLPIIEEVPLEKVMMESVEVSAPAEEAPAEEAKPKSRRSRRKTEEAPVEEAPVEVESVKEEQVQE